LKRDRTNCAGTHLYVVKLFDVTAEKQQETPFQIKEFAASFSNARAVGRQQKAAGIFISGGLIWGWAYYRRGKEGPKSIKG